MASLGFIPSGCGIAGSCGIETSDADLENMSNALRHRGPDGKGTWRSAEDGIAFAHRRLSIIGIDERGSQPMQRKYDDGQTLTITFNGEIYNYPQLKIELEGLGYAFTSASDTEAILHAYHRWGMDSLERFNGIFAFGLHDAKRHVLVLARDHVGVKPLVLSEISEGRLLFASEVKSLLQHSCISREPDFDSIRQDMIHGYWGDKSGSWFKGIRNLEPGTALMIDTHHQSSKTVHYWSPLRGFADIRNPEDACSELQSLIRDAVQLQMLSDVGVSVTNSGGLDSACITAIAASQYKERLLQAITVEYENGSPWHDNLLNHAPDALTGELRDLWHARKLVADHPNVEPLTVRIPKDAFHEPMIDALICALDQIPMDLRYASVYSMYERVRSLGHKVVLIGQGPDELFLGYYYDDDFWRFPSEHTSAAYLSSEFFPSKTAFGIDAWRPEFLDGKKASELSRLNMERNYLPAATDDPLNNLTFFAQRTMLQSVLTMEDRLSSAHSLEARVPWLDHRIVELAYRIPSYQKINAPDENKAKWLNRKAMRGIVPSHIADRRKAPFPHPPADYRAQILNTLIVPHLPELRQSDFLQHMFRTEFLESLDVNTQLNGKDLFKIYSLWRFGKLFFS